MNTTTHKGFAAVAAATAFFVVTACGAEVAPPTQDIGGTQQKVTDAPEQPARTTTPRGDFGDEYGTPTDRPEPEHDARAGVRPGMDFGV